MKKWYRSETDVKLGGVCSGISELFKWDVSIIRIVFFCLMFTPVPIITLYLAMWFILPKKGEMKHAHTHQCNNCSHCCPICCTCTTTATADSTSKKEFLVE